jgi:PAS domain S-box-containing protein
MSRWFTLKTFLLLCLIAHPAFVVGWVLVHQERLHRTFLSRPFLILEVGVSLVSALLITLTVLLYKRRASAVADMEANFRSLLDASPDPIAIMDGNGVVRLVNARAENLFQETSTRLVGKSINHLLFQSDGAADLENSLSDFRNSDLGDDADKNGLKARRKDGSWVPVEISFCPFETRNGTLTISILRDITERKRAEHLRDTRHAVRRILAEGGCKADAASRCLEALCKGLGQEVALFWVRDPRQQELLRFAFDGNAPTKEGLPLLDVARNATYAAAVGLPGLAWSDSKPIRSADLAGERDPLVTLAVRHGFKEAFAFPILFDAEVLGVIECFSREPLLYDEGLLETLLSIGSQIGRFLKHQQAEEAVRLSEARKAAILESALDAIITIDPDGKMLEFNPAAERLFGYERTSAIGQRMVDLIVPESSRGVYDDRLNNCRSREDTTGSKRIELSLKRADGQPVPVELVVTRIRLEGPPLFTCYIKDLTERVQAEQTLRRTEEQFQQAQKMEAIGRLAGGIAHDFNNLLTVINGYAQSMLSKLPAKDVNRGPIELIHKAGCRAASLTRQLLAFSRRQVLEPKVFNLNGVVADIGKMLQRMIGEDISLEVIPGNDLSRTKADQGRIEQVLMNLAVNARDAMPEGGKLTIETRNVVLDEGYARSHPEVTPGPYVLLAVSDTGVGMDEATRARIFEPFFTTKEVGKGTGLGLATVYGIIKQSGGHIAVYSELNRGSTFKVYLPVTAEKETIPACLLRPAFAPSGKGTVLLVEDEDMVRTLSSQILKEQGYTVLEARHGKEALAISEKDLAEVQLTVTDVVMPEMDGRDLARRLLVRKPNMKVLYVSGYTEKAIVRNGLLEPDTLFLEKPFSPEGLARKVHEMMSA